MADVSAVRRIGVFGHVGNGNLGDEAIVSVVIQNIRRRYPSAEIFGFTVNPEDTKQRHGVDAFPIRRIVETQAIATFDEEEQGDTESESIGWPSRLIGGTKAALKLFYPIHFLLKKIRSVFQVMGATVKEVGFLVKCNRNLEGIDLLIVAGSSQLIDYVTGGPWGHPYTIFKWVLLARAKKTKVAFLSCGAGPIRTLLGKFFIRKSLSLADYRSFRDEASSTCVTEIGVSGRNVIYPDLVYGMGVNKAALAAAPPLSDRPVVGINPVPFSDPQWWVGSNPRVYEIYTRALADFASWLIDKGYAVTFFPTQLRADPPVIQDILARMNESATAATKEHVIQCTIQSFDDLTSVISKTDFVVATRFHGVVVGYLLEKPVLGIAYASKTRDLMKQMGQGEYALDILKFDLALLQERFTALESQQKTIQKELPERLLIHRQSLEEQYEKMFQLVDGVHR